MHLYLWKSIEGIQEGLIIEDWKVKFEKFRFLLCILPHGGYTFLELPSSFQICPLPGGVWILFIDRSNRSHFDALHRQKNAEDSPFLRKNYGVLAAGHLLEMRSRLRAPVPIFWISPEQVAGSRPLTLHFLWRFSRLG